jgi:glycosyltransferase involved in cell wall biosynthesis
LTKDLISIIIPCYNDAKYVEQAVNSALAQTFQNKEIILIDDGSNDKTKAVLERLEPKLDKLITQSNYGQSKARNIGIAAAKGEYILVLDSDDYFEPTFCEKALEKIIQNQNFKIISCYAWLLFNDHSKRLFKPVGGKIDTFLFSNAAIGNSLFRKSDWQKGGGYDEEMKQGFEDWEFYIRLLKDGGEAYIIKEPLFNYRKRGNTTTARANEKKYDLWKYIFVKHKELYVNHYESFLYFFLSKLRREEKEKNKNIERLEFKLGKFVLTPFRKIKNLLIQTSK